MAKDEEDDEEDEEEDEQEDVSTAASAPEAGAGWSVIMPLLVASGAKVPEPMAAMTLSRYLNGSAIESRL